MRKVVAKPLDLAAGMAGGLVAGLLFRQVWRLATGSRDVPDDTDPDRGWGEILMAAALQGAMYALAKSAIARFGAGRLQRAVTDESSRK